MLACCKMKHNVVCLLEVARRARLRRCLAAADWDRCVYRDHFGEDVEDGLLLVSNQGKKSINGFLPWVLSCRRC